MVYYKLPGERRKPDATTPVVVSSNGSGRSQPLDALFAALRSEPLDPAFLRVGGYRTAGDGVVEFFGNFFNLSHVFRLAAIEGCEIERTLTEAIAANQRTPEFIAAVAADAAIRQQRAAIQAAADEQTGWVAARARRRA